MKKNIDISDQWNEIKTLTKDKKLSNFSDFKKSDFFYRITTWNPLKNGTRYFKILLYNLGMQLTPSHYNILSRIKNRDFGSPISVSVKGHQICYDYIQCCHEVKVISDNINLDNRNVLEIGAGYGRTCHSILSFFDCESYTIVDLEESLSISRQYLKIVLEEQEYQKINFVSIDDIDQIKNKSFDLAIQIDGFNEMKEDTVLYYLSLIDSQCENFYVKNPVGKYKDVGHCDSTDDDKNINLALKSGILTDFLDINSSEEIKRFSKKFIETYRVSDNWSCVYDGWAIPVSHVWESFYTKNK